ncbi:SGNH/GDSL hydrolase family protein [Microvirga sp. BT291]|uniref:SGNH/GDSL hydrolase family protein n=1 Tax=Microvirga pudoricolor TaxID=2778729 RepID=UPI00194E67F3|nr:SGNH/GDSL hydrolase family protein [Microvirga pudoricolor]MBM6594696.1 SGNH/GDSL hydrolase family protein [Microvirga pudoricolor]
MAGKLSRHEPVRILAIGSSSTEGIGASSPEKAYPAQLQEDLTVAWKDKVTVVNAGIGGETAIQTIDRLEHMLAKEAFDLVIWQVGTNDAVTGVDEEQFKARLERGIAAAQRADVDMILLDQQYFPGIQDLKRYEHFVGLVGAIAGERKISLFSRYALMREWNARSSDELLSMLSSDRFHMGDKGYDCLAGRVAQEIEAMAQVPVAQADTAPRTVATADAR